MVTMKELLKELENKLDSLTVREELCEFLASQGMLIEDKKTGIKYRQKVEIEEFKESVEKYIDELSKLPVDKAKETAKKSLIRTGVLNKDGSKRKMDSSDENADSFLKGHGIEDVASYLEMIKWLEKDTIKRIDSDNTSYDGAEIELYAHNAQTLECHNTIFVGRRFITEEEKQYGYVKHFLEFDITYCIALWDKCNINMINRRYYKVVKDEDGAILIESTNHSSPTFDMDVEVLKQYAVDNEKSKVLQNKKK